LTAPVVEAVASEAMASEGEASEGQQSEAQESEARAWEVAWEGAWEVALEVQHLAPTKEAAMILLELCRIFPRAHNWCGGNR